MTKQELIEKLKIERKPAIRKLVLSLMKYSISYTETDGDLDNVIFRRGEKTYKCTHEIFFRCNGRCIYKKPNDEIGILTDDMFYDWLKMYILIKLGVEKL